MPTKLVPSKQESLEKTSTKQKNSIRRFGDFLKRKHTKSSKSNTAKHDQVNKPDQANKPATLLEKDKFDYQIFDEPAEALKKDNVYLQKEDFCETAPIRVDMEHLFDCLTMDIESAVRPEIKLDCPPDNNKWNKNYFEILCHFSSYWNSSEKRLWENIAKKGKKGFVDFCEERINLFEKFFPLPEKYKLFAKGIANIAYESTRCSSLFQEDEFFLKYFKFVEIFSLFSFYNNGDVFTKPYPHDLLSYLENEEWEFDAHKKNHLKTICLMNILKIK